jgi:hypothetical protein
LSWVVVLCACSDSHRAEQAEPPIDEADYAFARTDAELSHAERCCERVGAMGTTSGFRDAVLRGLDESQPADDSGARYDPQAAAECVAALEAAPCPNTKQAPLAAILETCARIYTRGNRALGESCTSDFECAESDQGETICGAAEVTRHGIARECKALERAGEGQRCMSDDPFVELRCDGTLLCDDDSQRCVAPAARGERCLTGPAWGDTCERGSVCDRTDTERCIEPIAIGDACEDGELCEGLACRGGACREPISYSGLCEWGR